MDTNPIVTKWTNQLLQYGRTVVSAVGAIIITTITTITTTTTNTQEKSTIGSITAVPSMKLIGTIIFGFYTSTFVVVPWILASIAVIRNLLSTTKTLTTTSTSSSSSSNCNVSTIPDCILYVGRVWHTRIQPRYHSFTYPIFMFGINLCQSHSNLYNSNLWPLIPYIVQFNPLLDHFKDISTTTTTTTTTRNSDDTKEKEEDNSNNTTDPNYILCEKVFQLINDRTVQKQHNQISMNRFSHTIILLTHLTYYGYCFNPVSYYYIIDNTTGIVDCIVGEVSNTPWNEMYCYVLHPNSNDILTTTRSTSTYTTITSTSNTDIPINNDDETTTVTTNNDTSNGTSDNNDKYQQRHRQSLYYLFPKKFHVSPFMEMFYNYEWKFYHPLFLASSSSVAAACLATSINSDDKNNTIPPDGIDDDENDNRNNNTASTICIVNNLRTQDGTNRLQFHAKLVIQNVNDTNSTSSTSNNTIHPYTVAWYMTTYPVYCALIQVWIHYEAFVLFVRKGIPYQPHPNSTTTLASRIISTVMTPIFILQDYWSGTTSSTTTTTTTTTTITQKS